MVSPVLTENLEISIEEADNTKIQGKLVLVDPGNDFFLFNNNPQGNKSFKCYGCGKVEHLKKNYHMKLSKENQACEDEEDNKLNRERRFTTELVKGTNQAPTNYIDYKEEWIIDSGCSYPVIENDSLFS
ncbi:unnamed protein product [Dovyalis caffra]|uniref:Uncharacterized protein n=1 Tax=Dovyalis caffra TaxID=77055 RepID=A0AAV1RBX0_9ROSI|nr:unnamed protein product [Dovyalis caffra]